jgi:hypothetical protein
MLTKFGTTYIVAYNRIVANPDLPNLPEFHEYFNEVRRNANLCCPLLTTIVSGHFAAGDLEVKYFL